MRNERSQTVRTPPFGTTTGSAIALPSRIVCPLRLRFSRMICANGMGRNVVGAQGAQGFRIHETAIPCRHAPSQSSHGKKMKIRHENEKKNDEKRLRETSSLVERWQTNILFVAAKCNSKISKRGRNIPHWPGSHRDGRGALTRRVAAHECRSRALCADGTHSNVEGGKTDSIQKNERERIFTGLISKTRPRHEPANHALIISQREPRAVCAGALDDHNVRKCREREELGGHCCVRCDLN